MELKWKNMHKKLFTYECTNLTIIRTFLVWLVN